MAPPSIDTSVARSVYAASSKLFNGTSEQSYLAPLATRARSLSTASTSSSLSLTSPGPPSSSNASSSSLHLPASRASATPHASDQNPAASSGLASASTSTSTAQRQRQVRERDRERAPRYSPEPHAGNGIVDHYNNDYHTYGDFAPEPEPQDEYVLALHDFVPQQQNATCLSFRKGERIHVLNRDPSGWWDGELDGRRGWFPSNYVNKTAISLMDDDRPTVKRNRKGHGYSRSETSYVSRASTASPKPDSIFAGRSSEDTPGDLLFPAATSHTPPIMISLLHALQLLQNTTLSRRISHYQPSVACIIQCIRSVLQATDCLPREAPMLRRFPPLAQERKRVLSELALLVTQSKKASGKYEHEEQREGDEELMLRLAGQVFARVRRFLAVAVQCGVDLPERKSNTPSAEGSTEDEDAEGIRNHYGFNGDDEVYYPVTTTATAHKSENGSIDANADGEGSRRALDLKRCSTPSSGAHTGSAEDWDPRQSNRNTFEDRPSSIDSATPLIPNSANANRTPRARGEPYVNTSMQGRVVVHHRYKPTHMSISSSSSFSTSSSLDSPGTPMTPPFPEGPCTTSQVQQALRATHDQLLSTIAAFIGHVHSHSRSAHASSTGHLYALVRQIVDIVCRLLTLVDAVMGVEDVPWMKRAALENAKEHLYQMACALADAVREMATNTHPAAGEEEERGHLLKVATDALKAGSDCVSAVKTCLARPMNAPPLLITLPPMAETPAPSATSFDADMQDSKRGSVASAAGTILASSPSGDGSHESHGQVEVGYATTTPDYEEEDVTIQPAPKGSVVIQHPRVSQYDEDNVETLSVSNPERDRQQFIAALRNGLPNAPIEEEDEEEDEDEDLPSPSSDVRTDTYTENIDDVTTWEGSQRLHGTLEDKLINGELPSIPQANGEDGVPLAWTLSHDYNPHDVAYNSDGHLVGATLEALLEKMTPHDQIVDPAFGAIFFLTFRLFSNATELAESLIARFDLEEPTGLSELDIEIWRQRKLLPVRLRVSNFFKLWLETYWRTGPDDAALPILQAFVRGTMAEVFVNAAQRLDELINIRQAAAAAAQPTSPVSERHRIGERIRDAGMPINPPFVAHVHAEIPRPIMTKTLLAALRGKNFATIAITEFDALELARQMTLMECSLYCAITAEEMLEMGQPGALPAVNVKAVSTLSTAVTGWVAESILDEPDLKKRVLLVKFFIKVADRCTSLNNFSTPRSILAALDSSTISRLHQTWTGLAQKGKMQLESLRKLADHARNYHEYRSRLRNTAPPAVPFLGLYLTDLTFCREGNPSHRASPLEPNKKLLNFNKYHKLARIVQDMQRFQVSYNLKEIPEAQQYLQFCLDKAKDNGDLEDLYRRSQLLEPKQPAEAPSSELKTLFGWGSRSQSSSQTSQATLA